jgi:hypothetical protein
MSTAFQLGESGPELEALLKRLFIFVVGRIFNDDSIIVFTDYLALLRLHLCLSLGLLLILRGRQRHGDKLL